MLNFRSLASSSQGCCYHLSGGGAIAPLLIEAGIRFELIRKGVGFQVSALAGCLVTHAHGDHASATVDVMAAGVDVYASKETHAHVRNAQALRNRPYAEHRAHVVAAEEEFVVGDWIVMPFATVHDVPGALGFLVGSPDGSRLLFLTDTAYSPKRFEGLTHVAAEANWDEESIRANHASGRIDPSRAIRTIRTHMSLERLIDMLRENDLSRVKEIHLLHLSSENSDEARFKRRVEEAVGMSTFVAGAVGS